MRIHNNVNHTIVFRFSLFSYFELCNDITYFCIKLQKQNKSLKLLLHFNSNSSIYICKSQETFSIFFQSFHFPLKTFKTFRIVVENVYVIVNSY